MARPAEAQITMFPSKWICACDRETPSAGPPPPGSGCGEDARAPSSPEMEVPAPDKTLSVSATVL